MKLVLAMMLMVGCGGGGDVTPDAAQPLDGPPDAPPGTICSAYGEACHSDPYPANTVCHDGRGWCVDDVCRPMCPSNVPVCATLLRRVAPAGAHYCEPR